MPVSRARFVVEELPGPGGTARLPAAEAAHARARRLRVGDPILLCDGTGREAAGRLTILSARRFEVTVEDIRTSAGSEPEIALFVAGVRPERLAWIAEKATELSARSLAIVRTERTQAFRARPEKRERLERVVQAAAKQSGTSRWPALSGPHDLSTVLAGEAANRLFLDASGEGFPPRLAPERTAILVGPEGGWTAVEVRSARDYGWTVVALPAGRLRSETAAIAALVLARAALTR